MPELSRILARSGVLDPQFKVQPKEVQHGAKVHNIVS
jgi:hypothetical protein